MDGDSSYVERMLSGLEDIVHFGGQQRIFGFGDRATHAMIIRSEAVRLEWEAYDSQGKQQHKLIGADWCFGFLACELDGERDHEAIASEQTLITAIPRSKLDLVFCTNLAV